MRVLVAGANGQVGQHIVRFLAEGGYEVQAMIRSEDQAPHLRELGGEPIVADLEGEVTHTVEYDTRLVTAVLRSRTNTSPVALVSPGTRFDAHE